jgi:hypothetical protein
MADLFAGISGLSAVAALGASVLGALGILGAGLVYLRSSYVKERDEVRVSTISAQRELAVAQEDLCEAEKAELTGHLNRWRHHHRHAHPRCSSGPDDA